MSSIVIAGDTSGSVTLQAPAVAGSTVLNLPATSGTIQTSGAGYTTNGVAYATSTSALATGSALTFDGTKLAILSSSATVLESIKSTSSTSQAALFQVNNDADVPFNIGVFGSTAGSFGVLGANTPFISTNASTLNFVNTNASGVVVFGIGSSATERMRVDATNGLQVGTSTGNSGANGIHATGVIMQGASGLSQAQIVISGGNAIQAQTLGVGYENLRLSPLGGRVLCGTTSAGFSNSNSITIQPPEGYCVINHSGTSSGTNYIWFGYNGGSIGTISQNGTTAVAYNTSSDYRLKNNIAPMTGALEKVALLKPCTYKWNVDNSDGEGFIAHELAEVCPHAVNGEKDAIETYVDENGNEQTRPVYQGIDTSFLVATLTAAIQEQQALITTLTDRISVLENK